MHISVRSQGLRVYEENKCGILAGAVICINCVNALLKVLSAMLSGCTSTRMHRGGGDKSSDTVSSVPTVVLKSCTTCSNNLRHKQLLKL